MEPDLPDPKAADLKAREARQVIAASMGLSQIPGALLMIVYGMTQIPETSLPAPLGHLGWLMAALLLGLALQLILVRWRASQGIAILPPQPAPRWQSLWPSWREPWGLYAYASTAWTLSVTLVAMGLGFEDIQRDHMAWIQDHAWSIFGATSAPGLIIGLLMWLRTGFPEFLFMAAGIGIPSLFWMEGSEKSVKWGFVVFGSCTFLGAALLQIRWRQWLRLRGEAA